MRIDGRRRHGPRALALAAMMLGSAGPLGCNAFAQQPAPAAAVDRTLLPYAGIRDSARLPDGRTIHMVCMGQGSPVVVLTAGAGDWSITWNKVQPVVARTTRVCAWDRAGFGFSSPSPKPQTVADTTTDLQLALKARGVLGPYVMVGHSLGSFESLLMKDREPSKVVGMVLVDPSVPGQGALTDRVSVALAKWNRSPTPLTQYLKRCAANLRDGKVRPGGPDPDGCLRGPHWPPSYPPELRAALDRRFVQAKPDTIAAAMDDYVWITGSMETNSRLVVRPDRDYGGMPLIVLTAGDETPPSDLPPALKPDFVRLVAAWARAHDALAALSTRGVNRKIAGSGHYIQQARPQIVIEAIDQVLDEAREAGRTMPVHGAAHAS